MSIYIRSKFEAADIFMKSFSNGGKFVSVRRLVGVHPSWHDIASGRTSQLSVAEATHAADPTGCLHFRWGYWRQSEGVAAQLSR